MCFFFYLLQNVFSHYQFKKLTCSLFQDFENSLCYEMVSHSPTWTLLTEHDAAHIHGQNIYYFCWDILHRVMLAGGIGCLDQDGWLLPGCWWCKHPSMVSSVLRLSKLLFWWVLLIEPACGPMWPLHCIYEQFLSIILNYVRITLLLRNILTMRKRQPHVPTLA